MPAASSLLRSALGGAAFGGFLYLVGDTASDYLTFSRLRAAALQLADQDEELKQLVGQPYTTGFWYNSTLGFSHRDKVAHCTFQLQGTQRVTDIAVKGGRQQGPKSNVLYNIIGPGTWNVLSCQAMVPSEGGLVEARSLLPEQGGAAAADAADAAAGQAPRGARSSSSGSRVPAVPAAAAGAAASSRQQQIQVVALGATQQQQRQQQQQ